MERGEWTMAVVLNGCAVRPFSSPSSDLRFEEHFPLQWIEWLNPVPSNRAGGTMSEPAAYSEIVDFIAAGPNSERVASFQPSDETKARVHDLIRGEKEGTLSSEEREELEQYMQLEHMMRLAKARARRRAYDE
jgi:hypothetical protein